MVTAVDHPDIQMKMNRVEAKLKAGWRGKAVEGESFATYLLEQGESVGAGGALIPDGGRGNGVTALAAAPEDTAGLAKENASLRLRLQQAESDKLKAQQLLDATMNEMLKSMKTMHATVERIENSG